MSYIQGFNRKQAVLIPETIEQLIEENNPVRFIDAFVNSQDVVALGFKDIRFNKNGRPPFHPKDLLKLYIYGYLNKIRSSRALEKECIRNVELMWLIKGLVPDHNTISNFRRDNPKSIKKVFRATVNIEITDKEGFYTIDISLTKNLITSYKKKIELKQEMRGTADIITEDLRLMERFFYQMIKIFRRNE
ncbi:transposase [Lacinutrix jangbogonensis]|uniref:transposase n=1 Tax=Lacinutrix jangbogonensis TaxID=1469557 RepID=UPI00068B2657|nr:transposase [Lacinutrix jangbogonensis]